MDDWHLRVKLFGVLLSDALAIEVPATTLEEEATDKGTVFRDQNLESTRLSHLHVEHFGFMVGRVLLVRENELELERIDFDPVLSCIVLQNGSQETLSEEEAGEPENFRLLLVVDPAFEAADAHVQVTNVTGEGLQGRVGDFQPRLGDKALDQLDAGLQ